MAFLAIFTFTGAAALSIGAITASVAPQWRRILRLAAGEVESAPQGVR